MRRSPGPFQYPAVSRPASSRRQGQATRAAVVSWRAHSTSGAAGDGGGHGFTAEPRRLRHLRAPAIDDEPSLPLPRAPRPLQNPLVAPVVDDAVLRDAGEPRV